MLQAPYGFNAETTHLEVSQQKEVAPTTTERQAGVPQKEEEKIIDFAQLKKKKAWEIAQAPIRGIPSTAIMLYMTGNTLNLFPLMSVIFAMFSPLRALFSLKSTFGMLEEPGQSLLLSKVVFFAVNFAIVCIGLVKLSYMGLVPSPKDFIDQTIPTNNLVFGVKLVQ